MVAAHEGYTESAYTHLGFSSQLSQLFPLPPNPRHPLYLRPKEMTEQSGCALPSSPFHKPGLAEELSQVLTDSCTGGAHHEVQDHLETKRVRRLGSPELPDM